MKTTEAQRPAPSGPASIVVATDLGPVGEAAIRIAYVRAMEGGGHLTIVHVIKGAAPDIGDARALIAAQLNSAAGRAVPDATILVVSGDPADKIAECAADAHADLVILGSPEKPGGAIARLFWPSTIDKLVRRAPCAVLVSRLAPGTARVLVCTDLSDDEPLKAAAAEQRRHGAAITVLHCVPPLAVMPMAEGITVPVPSWDELQAGSIARLTEAIEEADLVATPRVICEQPARGILQVAAELAADLVIVGTHGRTGVKRIVLGSVAEQIVNEAPCPVMVVRLDR